MIGSSRPTWEGVEAGNGSPCGRGSFRIRGTGDPEGNDPEGRDGKGNGIDRPQRAGKSTLLKTIFGYLKAQKGKIHFKDREITNLSPRGVLERGISYVAQTEGLFPRMTVWENLRLGGFLIKDKRLLHNRIDWVLNLSNLRGRARQIAGSLSGGERRILEIGRGLMLDPEMVLLDEPSAALAPRWSITSLIISGRSMEKAKPVF